MSCNNNENRFVDCDSLGNVTEYIFGSRLWFLTEVSDGGRDALRGYSKKVKLGIFRSLDAHRYFSLW